jgi:hypothetical protein
MINYIFPGYSLPKPIGKNYFSKPPLPAKSIIQAIFEKTLTREGYFKGRASVLFINLVVGGLVTGLVTIGLATIYFFHKKEQEEVSRRPLR